MSILGKWIKVESILCEVTQSEKNAHGMYSLRIPKIQFTDHMNLKKEDQSVDTSVLRRGKKIPMGGVTKCGAETEGMTNQRLLHLVIHKPSHYCGCQDVLADSSLV